MKENRNQDEGNRKKRKFEGKNIVITGAGRLAALDTRISDIQVLYCKYARPDKTSDHGRCRKC